MTLVLPEPIETYFIASNQSVAHRLKECFTQDAVVLDEGGHYQGHTAIESWALETREKYNYTAEPITIVHENNTAVVTAKVTGNFPGSPISLNYHFLLADRKIHSLEIG
ncbi:nuclear transport factor 2 family protein [Gilvimarinus algae]|uniref:Nuclear transport factor 2 family protein n=1 Tax=Gilvimarinus algae TaxID=3058037 RepID=A0ABT8TGW0_9GAMM|nr:nuclear transport factor 2 family protein [Gilvimarinus sp. SDUM040014]MDO3383151.1 nuclear transport factor 2 family protein [Gilvimarinus sp. SDUM040014]